ncbi:MAG: hypothetical protein FJW95_08305 [Actinobacteria bacterium]|nr:hypothetical protein [Actinomycetota bacterium]
MPWCTRCDRFLSPSTVTPTGECPRCGATVDPGHAHAAPPRADEAPPPIAAAPDDEITASDEETPLPIPWHFKLLVGALALYLGWRAVQGVEWLARLL